jgi:hypothetical protein
MKLLGKDLPWTCDIHSTDRNNPHCRTSRITDIQLICEEDTFLRLRAESESEKTAPLDQALQKKYQATKVLQTKTDSKCRLHKTFLIKYTIISSCPILAKEQHINRNERLCAQLHFNISKEKGVTLDNGHWYEHLPKLVESSHEGTYYGTN